MFERCTPFDSIDIKYDDEYRLLSINNCNIRFTPTEYKVLRILLAQRTATNAALLEALSLQSMDKDASPLLQRYVHNARRKLRAHGLHITNIHEYGYALVYEGAIPHSGRHTTTSCVALNAVLLPRTVDNAS